MKVFTAKPDERVGVDMEKGIGQVTTEPLSNRALRDEIASLRDLLEVSREAARRCAIMLREGDHRIKNSLQIVASLMALQAGREKSIAAKEALHTAAARIRSVARMHDALQASGGEDSVNLGAALQQMCGALHDMAADPRGVDVQVTAGPVQLPVAIAQPIMLAVNELVVNSLRHAFPDGRIGTIRVKLVCAGGQLRVLVADDGVGLPAGHGEGPGYGMKLVQMMATKIEGVLHVDSGAGTKITIVAPAPDALAPARIRAAPLSVVSATAPGQTEEPCLARSSFRSSVNPGGPTTEVELILI